MGSTKSHWVQDPPPKTYKEKYLKLRELIMSRYKATEGLTYVKDRNAELMNLRVLINTMERTSDKDWPWDMSKK